eukprot:TRINITY_DN21717_c0_g2_i1.p1 TRINITY_DN21717_c0_g2~~TRINITY_DN21717_c0_g2_i1.p1  ORF type:complete len:256 (+),score=70.60 TRINITY_DN21717_c0_g2_i1:113-880(+)
MYGADVPQRGPEPELEDLSMEELQVMLQERDAAVVELKHEIEMLRNTPQLFQRRLADLEAGVLSQVHKGVMLEVNAPILDNISKIIREDHLLEHQEACKAHADAYEGNSHYLEADDLVLGRAYMSLDQKFKEEEARRKELQDHPHPVISEFHYGGHLSTGAPSVPAPAPGPPDQSQYGPPRGPSGANPDGFWLEERVSKHHLQARAPEKCAYEHDLPGDAEDAIPIDWLGRAKRGLPHHKPSLQRPVFAAPSWLY